MPDSKRTAMEVADEAQARIERLNAWCSELHRRLWVIEQKLGIEPLHPLEHSDSELDFKE